MPKISLPPYLGQAQTDPDSLLVTRSRTLDEVQRAPELLLPLKRQVDRQRHPGDFLLMGSANLLLMGNVAESLAGRAIYLELPPFCLIEWQERHDRLRPLNALFEPGFKLTDWPDEAGDWADSGCCEAGFRRRWTPPRRKGEGSGLPGMCKPTWNAT